ncbi:MAG: polyphosphate kinase 1 [Methanospirillum sp.]|nr:polyphosphate kinase 1 [Methanospirillum sp.]
MIGERRETGEAGEAGRATLGPGLFINRELSWVEFNRRVLDEALDPRHPLLERVKFLAIFASNLDEFWMIRVAGLRRQLAEGVVDTPPDGMSPRQQLDAVRAAVDPLLEVAHRCWADDLRPALDRAGIGVRPVAELGPATRSALRRQFEAEIFPALTPLAFDTSHPFPFISNLSLNLAFEVRDADCGDRFARLKVPVGPLPRLVEVPRTEGDGRREFVFLEDLIAANADLLFPGIQVVAAYPFRVTRNADLEIAEDEADDLLSAVEESVELRRTGAPVRVEVDRSIPEARCRFIARQLGIATEQVSRQESPIGLADLAQLAALSIPKLTDPPFLPAVPAQLASGRDPWAALQRQDLLLYHPYDSFGPVLSFLQHAARDPGVLAIKITLYRVGPNSPIVDALMEARENGKQVTALIELKARFDEENNIVWARALEQAGVHVVYGLLHMKVHAKVCLVVRRERQGLVRYVHLGTGNYNTQTARIYTDIGLLTRDPRIGADVSDLFNYLTGYARIERYRELLVAPGTLRAGLLDRVEREIARHREHGDGRLIFKMNALVDRECIEALYRASQAGVRVDLQVRGICCLRPGIPGVSDRITVTSIVGRFLEHARVYCFWNGGDAEVWIGSADLMPRNLNRRVEVLFPVRDPFLRDAVVRQILLVHLDDTAGARRLLSDGTYERVLPREGEASLDTQAWMVEHRGEWSVPPADPCPGQGAAR